MLYFLKKLYTSDLFFYGALCACIVFLAQIPIILHWLQTPAGYYYPLIDRPSFSEYYYLALIRYGMEGGWLSHVPYVISDYQGSLIQILFVLMGKIGYVVPLGPAEIFALFRIIGGVILLASVISLLRLILSKNQARMAFFLFLFIQPLPYLDKTNLLPGYFEDFDYFVWHFGEAARRVSMMPPHYTLGKGLAVLSLVFLILFLRKKRIKLSVIGGIIGFLAGMIYPPPVFILLVSMGVSLPFLYLLISPQIRLRQMADPQCKPSISLGKNFVEGLASPISHFKLLYAFFIPAGYILSLLLLQYEVGKGYPWNMWNRVELGWNDPSMHFEWSYIHMIGIFLLFGFFGIVRMSLERKKEIMGLFFTIWGLSAFLLFPFANLLHVGKFRLTEGLQILPLAIVGARGILGPAVRVSHISFQVARPDSKSGLASPKLLITIILGYFLFWSFFSTQWSIVRIKGWFTNVYFRPQELQALKFLQTVPKDSVVLADQYPSNFIPAFARVRTLIGFSDFYPNFQDFQKEQFTINLILEGKVTEKEIKAYAKNHFVNYIYREVDQNKKTSNYYKGILEKVFENERFEIYFFN